VTRVWERIIRGLGIVTVAVFIIIALTPAGNVVGRRFGVVSGQLKRADAIVVLGAGVLHNGVLSEQSMRRAIAGIALFRRDMAPRIVLSGPGRTDSINPSEAGVRAKLAVAMGIPPGAILMEETAKTTREEAIHIANTLQARDATRILLVTDSLHMRRAVRVFERSGLHVQPAVSDDYSSSAVSPGDRLWLAMRICQESAALVYYKIAGYI
jgi:uncharacterized SAM-binding protein YcdF (DUF218 family)